MANPEIAATKLALSLKGVEKSYGTRVKTPVLFGIDLDIPSGSFNSIIGQSGSGKSTLLNIIGTLLSPDAGTIIINERDVSRLKVAALSRIRAEEIGFVFQSHLLIPEFTALENVLMPYRILHGKLKKSAMDHAERLLELVGLKGFENNMALNMSGGQQQRTAIARSLMNKPSIILADEPTGNLDSVTTETIYGLLRDINAELGTTFLIVTHDRRIAEKTDRIIEIRDGRIVADLVR
jgi:lipoprotein-releasing system ATP-binding protein